MPRRKLKFNRKAFGRFRKNELIDFMKNSDFKMEKKLSRYSKGEIVLHLIRLQRNKLYYQSFEKLEFKEPKKMSDAQKKNLARGRANSLLKQGNRVMKQQIPKKQQIDLKPVVQDSNNVNRADAVKNTRVALAKVVSQQPTALHQVKFGEEGGAVGGSLEDLFKASDRRLSEERAEIQRRINKRKADVRSGRKGKLETDILPGVSVPSTRPDRVVEELPGESEFQPVVEEEEEFVDPEDLAIIDPEEQQVRNIVTELAQADQTLVKDASGNRLFSRNFVKLLLQKHGANPTPNVREVAQGVKTSKGEQLARVILANGGNDIRKLLVFFGNNPRIRTKDIKTVEQLDDLLFDASNV